MPLPTSAVDDMEEHQSSLSKIGIFCILATICNPQSRGSVRPTSSSPDSFPAVGFGILSHPNDLIIARRAVHLALSFGKTMLSSGSLLLRPITFPSENQNLDIENGNQEQMDRFIRHGIRNAFHYSPTCQMGSESDEEAPGVVNGVLRVHGVRGVRIADTSVFPRIVSHHPMVPAVMVAERCADFIVDDAGKDERLSEELNVVMQMIIVLVPEQKRAKSYEVIFNVSDNDHAAPTMILLLNFDRSCKVRW